MGDDRQIAPDGSPVLLYRRLPPGDEPSVIHAALAPGSTILELGAGAGRITHALIDLGHQVVAVDQSPEMLRWVRGAQTVIADIEELDLRRRFDAVVLGSHLVNTPDDRTRAAFLATCRRHVADDGLVLVEHHEEEWAENARDSRVERDGVVLALSGVRREAALVSATMVYEIEGETFQQPFVARVLSHHELSAELERAGLRLVRQVTPTWAVAAPMSPDDKRPAGSRATASAPPRHRGGPGESASTAGWSARVDARPAHVVVFEGTVDMPRLGVRRWGSRPSTARDVVCVVTADGFPIIYTDVSRAGARFPQELRRSFNQRARPRCGPDLGQ